MQIQQAKWCSGLDESNPLVSTKSWGEKTPSQLTEDYLSAVYKHIMYMLEQKLGSAMLRTIPMEFSLTVPAIWTEAAKDKTLRAWKKAGFREDQVVSLVSEPVLPSSISLFSSRCDFLLVAKCGRKQQPSTQSMGWIRTALPLEIALCFVMPAEERLI